MQSHDPLPNPALVSPNPRLPYPPTMDEAVSSPIRSSPGRLDTNGDTQKPETNDGPETKESNPIEGEGSKELGSENMSSKSSKNGKKESNNSSSNTNSNIVRRERPTRACTARPAKYLDRPVIERRPRPPKREKVEKVEVEEVEEEEERKTKGQCGNVVTSLVNAPTPEQMPRWNLRSMWQLASILNFFHVFRPLLNITIEFSAEELESALLTPNATLGDIHLPLLRAIPPVTRMACGRDTWVTVLCRKLRDWWHWVAEGELPIVTNHGAEIETYRTLDPSVRVVILKALCDIRLEQDDIRSYIDNSLKHGVQLSAFRKERIGGDSHGISYWYEDDEIIGHRLYREIRKAEKKVEVKKGKAKGSHVLPSIITYEWETVATNLDEFLVVSEKLFSSKNRTEASLGKKLKNDMLPEIEKIHKRKERLLKKQQREALLLDNFVNMDGLAAGRSLRDRKPVTYTFDDFDRSISEAIKITKRKQPSPEPAVRREGARSEPSANGRWNGPSPASLHVSFSPPSPIDYDDMEEDHRSGALDRSRRRQRPQRYSDREFVEAISDQEEDFGSDDDIVGEAVYDEEYLRQRKHRKNLTSSSEGEGDEEYQWSEENGDDEAEEEEDSLSLSEDSDQPRGRFKRSKSVQACSGTKLKSVDELQAGLRRSKRATRNHINYRKYELSESENESTKSGMADASEKHSDATTDNVEYSMESQDSEGNNDEEREKGSDQHTYMDVEKDENGSDWSTYMDVEKDENQPMTKPESPSQDDPDGGGQRKFLDLNELAPGSGFEDGPSAILKHDGNSGKHE